MRVLTWNVNGIRSQSRSVKEMLDHLSADVICVQETKISREMLDSPTAIVEGYTSYFSFCQTKSGYSGVATFCRNSHRPVDACDSLQATDPPLADVGRAAMLDQFTEDELHKLDREGRTVITEHTISYEDTVKSLVIINVYCPRVDWDKPDRADYQTQFHQLVQIKAEAILQSGRHVIVTGDLNVSHREVDHCKPEENPDFENRPSRLWLDQLLLDVHHPDVTSCDNPQCTCGLDRSGKTETEGDSKRLIDLFRYYYPSRKNAFTCWNSASGAREHNFGTRLDYIICDVDLPSKTCDILPDIQGSDHCPMFAEFDVKCIPSDQSPKCCTENFKEFIGKQRKISDFFTKGNKNAFVSKSEFDFHESKAGKRSAISSKASVSKKAKLTKSHSQGQSLLNFGVKKVNSDPTKVADPSNIIEFSSEEHKITNSQNSSDLCEREQALSCSSSSTSSSQSSQDSDSASKPKKTLTSSGWANIFKPPVIPKCKGHQEPCVQRTVIKKESLNRGRKFWVCARNEGPKTNPESRCDHFEWDKSIKTTKSNSGDKKS